jgi:hypothetical protein
MGYSGIELAAGGQAVEGVIVAHEVDDALRYAVNAQPAIRLMTYQVAFSLTDVDIPGSTVSMLRRLTTSTACRRAGSGVPA